MSINRMGRKNPLPPGWLVILIFAIGTAIGVGHMFPEKAKDAIHVSD